MEELIRTMEPPILLLEESEPSQYEFLAMISDLLDEDMLQQIAEADYGYEAEYCFSELKKIKEAKTIPSKIEFSLREVLELTRWTEPKTTKEHIMRAFSCSCLLILYPILAYPDDENATLATFVESVATFDSKYQKSAFQLVTWRILFDYAKSSRENEEEIFIYYPDTFFIYALLQLMILNQDSAARILTIAKWLVEDENSKRKEQYTVVNQTFLLGLTHDNLRHHTWVTITSQMLTRIEYITDRNVTEKLVEIANSILDTKETKQN